MPYSPAAPAALPISDGSLVFWLLVNAVRAPLGWDHSCLFFFFLVMAFRVCGWDWVLGQPSLLAGGEKKSSFLSVRWRFPIISIMIIVPDVKP